MVVKTAAETVADVIRKTTLRQLFLKVAIEVSQSDNFLVVNDYLIKIYKVVN
jgi:hypothetical protein